MYQVRDEAMKAGMQPTRESVWSYFIKKSAGNLHIVLCMSPIGETLKTRCRNFPGLVNNTSIDWFTAWPKQALQAVAGQFLAEVSLHRHPACHLTIKMTYLRGHTNSLGSTCTGSEIHMHTLLLLCTCIVHAKLPVSVLDTYVHTYLEAELYGMCFHLHMYMYMYMHTE